MVSAWMPVTWEDERVGVIIVFVSTSVFVCVFDELQPFFSLFFYCTCSTSSWDLAKLKNLTLLFGGGYPTLTGRERIKKLAVCCSIQGLFIMYLLPLFKSLMQEVRSHMTEREREGERERERERERTGVRGAAYVCVVWRNEDPCAVMFKQRLPWKPHTLLVALSKPWDEAPQLPLALMHAHAYARTRALNPRICKGISTFDWGSLCTNGTSVCRGTIRGGFWSLGCVTEKWLSRVDDNSWFNVKWCCKKRRGHSIEKGQVLHISEQAENLTNW